MVKCSFCGSDLPIGGGKLYAKKDGTSFYFCSTKCEKNALKLNRKPVKTRWTDAYKKVKEARVSSKDKKKE
jgi:large subunit ribosomal protein L24e